MGIGMTVHGFIAYPDFAEGARLHRHNSRIVARLPRIDNEWPFLTRGMFSLLPRSSRTEIRAAQYDDQLIHFAGSYKNMYRLEAAWLVKFERVLSMLCWTEAEVHFSWSGAFFRWHSDWGTEHFLSNPPKPPTQWFFRIYQSTEVPATADDTIDGNFVSPHHLAGYAPWETRWHRNSESK